jgi:hypothetical protein
MKPTNPKDIIGMTKPPLRLVPPALMIFVSRAMALGAKKYGPYNWRGNRVRRTVYLEAALRHILQALDGEDIDEESGQPHEAHAAACMGIILDAAHCGALIDDRATPGPAGKLIRKLTLPAPMAARNKRRATSRAQGTKRSGQSRSASFDWKRAEASVSKKLRRSRA